MKQVKVKYELNYEDEVYYYQTRKGLDNAIERITRNLEADGYRAVVTTPNYPVENDIEVVFIDAVRR